MNTDVDKNFPYQNEMKKEKKMEDYIWKGPRINGVQEEVKLVDCDLSQLQTFYRHCQKMLYNESTKTPGRLTLIEIIEDQIRRCRAELLVRWLRAEKGYTYQSCYDDIKELIGRNKEVLTSETIEKCPISSLMSEIPNEYKRVPIGLVLQACLYALGVLNTSHITLNFLTKLGVYLTQQEMQVDLFERDPETGKARNRMEVIKEREGLNPALHLECTPTGLSYAEFHQMCKLRTDKYEKFTTPQLKILSEKVLYRFQLRCEEQAKRWQEKAEEILEVAASKGWSINAQIS